jgi:hypothetical protein
MACPDASRVALIEPLGAPVLNSPRWQRRVLRREWEPHPEPTVGTTTSQLSNLLTVLADALGTRSR